jgi:hypothetical protein
LNRDAIKKTFGSDDETANEVLGGNAIRILKLHTQP